MRIFTRHDDELIVRHSRGEFSFHTLREVTHYSLDELRGRARSLGVTLNVRTNRRCYTKMDESHIGDWKDFECTVGEDLLLEALKQYYPNRRYKELNMKVKS